MRVRRVTIAALAAMPVAVLAVLALPAVPASAHGATSLPSSRAFECGPLGGAAAKSAACRAADTASGGPSAFTAWDNLRVPNVNGQDRQKIPDGKLCSGGLTAFRGLDLARADWPTTSLAAGARFAFQYRTTIPHQGSFRLYVTKDGYAPAQPLRWADLEAAPFATVTDPPVRNGAYVFTATLPAHKSGRHLIYAIWQTTSTPDTYYSCSDVVFTAAPAAATPAAATPASPSDLAASPAPTTHTVAAVPAAARGHGGTSILPFLAGGGMLVLLAAGALLWRSRRRMP